MAYPKNDQTYPTVYVMSGYQFTPVANTITCIAGGAEMLRVSPDGFWVRGQKVEQDDTEAQVVYNAFKAWMAWAQLNRDYQ
jgi:hypothetical protein